jgi:hypothetical protein
MKNLRVRGVYFEAGSLKNQIEEISLLDRKH